MSDWRETLKEMVASTRRAWGTPHAEADAIDAAFKEMDDLHALLTKLEDRVYVAEGRAQEAEERVVFLMQELASLRQQLDILETILRAEQA